MVLEKYFNCDNLKLAWERMLRWSDSTIKDHWGISVFEANLDDNLGRLSNKLINNQYEPIRPQKFYVPKSSGTQRTKTILMIEDAIVYQAIVNIIAYENYDKIEEFYLCVFGNVLNEEVKFGENLISNKSDLKSPPSYFFYKPYLNLYNEFSNFVNGVILDDEVNYKLETDITGFFDSIPHFSLLEKLNKDYSVEEDILELLSLLLNCWSGTKSNMTIGVGIPQGPGPSHFLANILLYDLDEYFMEKMNFDETIYYCRYMDDIRIYSSDTRELRDCLMYLDTYLKGFALSINSSKTSIREIVDRKNDDSIIDFHVDYKATDMEVSKFLKKLYEEHNLTSEFYFKENKSSSNLTEDESAKELKQVEGKENVIKFWKDEINDVEDILLNSFENKDGSLSIPLTKVKSDRFFVNLSYRYRIAIRSIKEQDADIEEIDYSKTSNYWLFLIKEYPWRANYFCLVLNEFPSLPELKQHLISLVEEFEAYEWITHHLFLTLSIKQVFTDDELKSLLYTFGHLTDYAKLGLYKLLIAKLESDDVDELIDVSIKKEPNAYLRKTLMRIYMDRKRGKLELEPMLNSFGL